jgi:hypothetical protein
MARALPRGVRKGGAGETALKGLADSIFVM